MLVKNKVLAICEGANMPCTADAINVFKNNNILFAPGKAANAGGVAVSALEMHQNSSRLNWPAEKVDQKLQEIMTHVHEQCATYGLENSSINYIKGANIGGFIRVADAMLEQGYV